MQEGNDQWTDVVYTCCSDRNGTECRLLDSVSRQVKQRGFVACVVWPVAVSLVWLRTGEISPQLQNHIVMGAMWCSQGDCVAFAKDLHIHSCIYTYIFNVCIYAAVVRNMSLCPCLLLITRPSFSHRKKKQTNVCVSLVATHLCHVTQDAVTYLP